MQTNTSNPVLSALVTRRSTHGVTAERPARELVEQVIAAGAWGPNHYHTEPWRFIVVAGNARRALGAVMAEALRARMAQQDGSEVEQLVERERKKPLRAPVVIAVGAVPSDLAKSIEVEEISAVAAGIQNMLIAAHALGLGAMWRTGAPAYEPEVKGFLGLPKRAHILAFIYLGFPQAVGPGNPSADAAHHTTWLGWDAD